MKRVAVLVIAAACSTPAYDLAPRVQVTERADGQLAVFALFDGGDDVDVVARFRGKAIHLSSLGDGDYHASFVPDPPLADDEPVEVEIQGISMTLAAPPGFGGLQVPLFISRSHDTTLTWTVPSDDPIGWWVSWSGCVSGQGGSMLPAANSVTLTPASWMLDDGYQLTCATSLDLYRWRESAVDPIFQDGRLLFSRHVDAAFASMP